MQPGSEADEGAPPTPGSGPLALKLLPGAPYPQGAVWDGHGTNFAVWSEQATAVSLCLDADGDRPAHVLALPRRSGGVWHGYAPGVGPGQRYGYRADGPYAPHLGQRFNPNKLLVDPYARAIDRPARWHELLAGFADHDPRGPRRDTRDSAPVAPRGIVVDPSFDWGDDRNPGTDWGDTVIYECHVKGLTALHPDLPPELRGTYRGLASEPVIEHLRSLGVTAVELLPVAHSYSDEFLVARGLCNYWGYDGIGYFAPDSRFCVSRLPGEQVREFKQMVQALHRAGIEVLLDVVYNHTGEGGALGPTLSLRGLGNAAYYQLDPRDPSRSIDFTGCGHTLNLSHPQTARLVHDSVRFWVEEMHVDGFRFDLAPALARTVHGLNVRSGLFAALARDPVLRRSKLIVEPWDIAGVARGEFEPGFVEWNDRYRDTVRRFWRGDGGQVGELAARLTGSSDLFEHSRRPPQASLNFVTCHDGFTLRDLTSYDRRHNLANGWQDRDGSSENYSRNWGAEGESADPAIGELRDRAARSMLATLGLSLGVPMLLQGDEMGRGQRGNNNPYGQDNQLSWVCWELGARERALLRDTRHYLAIRRALGVLRRSDYFRGQPLGQSRFKDVTWLRPDGEEMQGDDWRDHERRTLGAWFSGHDAQGRPDLTRPSTLLLLNGGPQSVRFRLPASAGVRRWRVTIDTAQHVHDTPSFASDEIAVAAAALCLLEQAVQE